MTALTVSTPERLKERVALDLSSAQTAENADACTMMWIAAIREYARDARAYDRHGRCRDGGEAYTDLLTTCELLANLCEPIGLTLDAAKSMVFDFVG